jgi:hypothetical protein
MHRHLNFSVEYRAADYNDFYGKILKAVGMVGMEIRRTVDEVKGTKLVGIVSVDAANASNILVLSGAL